MYICFAACHRLHSKWCGRAPQLATAASYELAARRAETKAALQELFIACGMADSWGRGDISTSEVLPLLPSRLRILVAAMKREGKYTSLEAQQVALRHALCIVSHVYVVLGRGNVKTSLVERPCTDPDLIAQLSSAYDAAVEAFERMHHDKQLQPMVRAMAALARVHCMPMLDGKGHRILMQADRLLAQARANPGDATPVEWAQGSSGMASCAFTSADASEAIAYVQANIDASTGQRESDVSLTIAHGYTGLLSDAFAALRRWSYTVAGTHCDECQAETCATCFLRSCSRCKVAHYCSR